MHTKVLEIFVAIILGLLIPSLLILMLQDRAFPEKSKIIAEESSVTESEKVSMICVETDDGVAEIPIEEYVLAVVLHEMPANFECEALKAQAVVARTYALRRMEKGGKHAAAAVCTRSSCCQGFCGPDEYLSNGGTQKSIDKVAAAVDGTSGLVLTYSGELIDATYFSCSGGATEAAEAVWGKDVPYLQSVQSPGEEAASHYVDTIQISVSEFMTSLGVSGRKLRIGNITYTEGGGVDSIEICDKIFTGTLLRKIFSLRSTAIYISVVGSTVTITTRGYGHRVGMSQYGADAMAVSGASFQEILLHYYQGTEVIRFNFD